MGAGMTKTHLYLEDILVTEKILLLIRPVIVRCELVVNPTMTCWLKGGAQFTDPSPDFCGFQPQRKEFRKLQSSLFSILSHLPKFTF